MPSSYSRPTHSFHKAVIACSGLLNDDHVEPDNGAVQTKRICRLNRDSDEKVLMRHRYRDNGGKRLKRHRRRGNDEQRTVSHLN